MLFMMWHLLSEQCFARNDLPGGQCPQERWSEEGRQSGHLHASLSLTGGLHVGLCQDWRHSQVLYVR